VCWRSVAARSFHWIDPAVRYEKSAALLRDRGALAIVATKHVLPPGGDPFFAEEDDDRPPRPDDVADLSDEILASGVFVDVTVRRHLWDVVYTADEYVAVLDTYSEQRALDQAARDELYGRVRRRIEGTPGGTVRKSYLATLNLARRSPTRARRSARKS
jgi:hypothetical protein